MGKMRSLVFGSALSIAISRFETCSCRGWCPLTGKFMVMMSPVICLSSAFLGLPRGLRKFL